MPTASTQPQASGQRHTQIAGSASSRVEKIANWVRIISGVSESDSRFTSRIEKRHGGGIGQRHQRAELQAALARLHHHQHADEAHDGGAPAPPAHLLAGDHGGHHTENSGCEKAIAVASASGSIDTA